MRLFRDDEPWLELPLLAVRELSKICNCCGVRFEKKLVSNLLLLLTGLLLLLLLG
jgi:hypothetical protein